MDSPSQYVILALTCNELRNLYLSPPKQGLKSFLDCELLMLVMSYDIHTGIGG